MTRRTKIVATVGPASDSAEVLAALIDAGVNVFRLNFSHGGAEHHATVTRRIRQAARDMNKQVGILADLQGPKIRIAGFVEGRVELAAGQAFALDLDMDTKAGTIAAVGLEYAELRNYVDKGDTLLLDDGRIQLVVELVTARTIECVVTVAGFLGSHKGINKLGGGIAAPALTAKDRSDIVSLGKVKPDFVAISFVSSAEDIHLTRRLLAEQNLSPSVIAKIERAEVVADETLIDDILRQSDGIMVARGDLGVEVGDAELIGIQKHLIRRSRQLDRVVITATQMMESMIENPMPTRAEVFDVANAVLDGTDAVMLSAETAVGRYPVEVVTAMAATCVGAEKHPTARTSRYRVDRKFNRADESIAMAAIYTANHSPYIRGILCMTESGGTPLLMSRLSSGLPIFALSGQAKTLGKLCLCRGVIPLYFEQDTDDPATLQSKALNFLRDSGYCDAGQSILLTHGDIVGSSGFTNTMKILTLEA